MKKVFKRKLREPLVSVVVTIYNEAKVVDEAIRTLLAQSYKKTELILVDNGSSDRTMEVIGAYRKTPGVRILHLPKNLGPGGGRNAGAKIAKGKILIFIDADMVFDKDYLKGLLVPVLTGKAVGSFHDTELVKNIDKVWARSFSMNRVENPGETSGVFRSVLRDAFLSTGGFDTSKGYFDDGLGGIGPSVRAHAKCYHNNPDNLREIAKHSRWVGRSLIQDTHNRRIYGTGVVLSWIAGTALIVLVFFGYATLAAFLAIVASALLSLFVIIKGIKRSFKDGYPEFIITVPIVWLVRLTSYWCGATGELLRRTFRRKS